MMSGSMPETPNASLTTAAQGSADMETSSANVFQNNFDEESPNAQVNYIGSGKFKTFYFRDAETGAVIGERTIEKEKRVVSLKPKAQSAFDAEQDIKIAINEWALAQVGILKVTQQQPLNADSLTPRTLLPAKPAIDTSLIYPEPIRKDIITTGLVDHVHQVRDAIDSRLQYQINEKRVALEARLVHQGLSAGMQAYDRAMALFAFEENDARNNALIHAGQEQSRVIALEGNIGDFHNRAQEQKFRQDITRIEFNNNRAIQDYETFVSVSRFVSNRREVELQEKIAIRAQHINEISGLQGQSQVQPPHFAAPTGSNIARSTLSSNVYQSKAMDMEKYKMEAQQQQAMIGGIIGLTGNLAGGYMSMNKGG